MSEFKGTPGPWQLALQGTLSARWLDVVAPEEPGYDDGSDYKIASTGTTEVNRGGVIEQWEPAEDGEEVRANARLIAAAPDLLGALQRLLLLCDEEGHDGFCNLLLGEDECSCGATEAHAAIAKALGQ